MTQIVGLVTEEYVLLASDRMVTYQNGDLRDDKTCKLVNFGNIAGIAHAGLAEMGGYPMNEWIGKTLAENNCKFVYEVVTTLKERATVLIKDIGEKYRSIEIIIVGWANFKDGPELRPHLTKLSNCYDANGNLLAVPKAELDVQVFVLKKGQQFLAMDGGLELTQLRKTRFSSEVAEVLNNQGMAKEVLNIMNQEIIRTSLTQEIKTVGTSILSMCLPRTAAINAMLNGNTFFVSKEPSDLEATFYYFENGYSELIQIGPTFVFNGSAVTDIVVENIPDKQFQSSQMRVLHLSKENGIGLAVRYSNEKSKNI